MLRSILCASFALLGAGCFAQSESVACTPGDVGCTCTSDGQCDDAFVCQQNYCMPDMCTPGEMYCSCDQGACLGNLQCTDGAICLPPPGSETGDPTASGSDTSTSTTTSPTTTLPPMESSDATTDELTTAPTTAVDSDSTGSVTCEPGTASFANAELGTYKELALGNLTLVGDELDSITIYDPDGDNGKWPFMSRWANVVVSPAALHLVFSFEITRITFEAGRPSDGQVDEGDTIRVSSGAMDLGAYVIPGGTTDKVDIDLASNPVSTISIEGVSPLTNFGVDDIEWRCD